MHARLVRDTELTNHNQSEEFQKSQKETPVHMSFQPSRILLTGIHLGWAMFVLPGRTLSQNDESETSETNPITRRPEIWSHMAEQSFWVPWLCCSPPGCPCPVKFLALSACVSPWTIHFWMLGKSLFSGPGRGHLCHNSYRALEQPPYLPKPDLNILFLSSPAVPN